MEVASPGQGVNGGPPAAVAAAATTMDSQLIVEHLVDLLEITLGASRDDLEAEGSLLSESKRQDTIQRCTRFANESQVVLYVQKDVTAVTIPNGSLNGHSDQGTNFYRHIAMVC